MLTDCEKCLAVILLELIDELCEKLAEPKAPALTKYDQPFVLLVEDRKTESTARRALSGLLFEAETLNLTDSEDF